MAETFKRLDKLREAGQKEYAHTEDNAFRNFEDTGKDLNIPREKVLWIFMKKHLDGILAHINGHRSQRESVHGRIDDAHVYLELLRAMIIDNESSNQQDNRAIVPLRGHCNCGDLNKNGPCPTHSLGVQRPTNLQIPNDA